MKVEAMLCSPPKTSESGGIHLYTRGRRGASMRRDATRAAKESLRLRRLWVEEAGGGRREGPAAQVGFRSGWMENYEDQRTRAQVSPRGGKKCEEEPPLLTDWGLVLPDRWRRAVLSSSLSKV